MRDGIVCGIVFDVGKCGESRMKFSVITVCFNAAKTIEKTIMSVLNQGYRDLEYIIIDGNSTDGTQNIIRRYETKIDKWVSEPDRGIYDAMNKGVRLATGDVFAFLNADDWYEDHIISKINQYFEREEIDIVAGSEYFIIDEKPVAIISSKYDLDKPYLSNTCNQPSLFIKKKVFDLIGGFNAELKYAADYEFVVRAWKNKVTVLTINDICTNFRADGVSNSEALYLSRRESHEVAQCLLGEEYSADIHNLYSVKMEKVFYEDIFWNNIKNLSINWIKGCIADTGYYIWGSGMQGGMCLTVFERLGVSIEGIVDNSKNKQGKTVGEYRILAPADLKKGIKICIATREHDAQVERQLLEMGYQKEDYIIFSDIVREAVVKQTGQTWKGQI